MRRRIAFAALLLLMLGQPMNSMASQHVSNEALAGSASSSKRFVPESIHQCPAQDELAMCLLAKDDQARVLPGSQFGR